MRPNRALCVPLQTKTRTRPLADTARNGSCLPHACRALHTIAPAAHDANKTSNTKNGRAKAVDQAYRLRWQIELLFKEWKSYANLHAFNTANPAIAEGLVWAAIGAAAMKRFLAHLTQVLHGVQVSTRKVAMCAHHVLVRVIDALISKSRDELHEAFRVAVEYLATNAKRAHPKRERRTGRLQLGIAPVLNVR